MSPANRFPASKHEVDGCSSCPLRVPAPESQELDFEREDDAEYKCAHPETRDRDVTGEEGVPDFCPLERAPLLLALSPEARR